MSYGVYSTFDTVHRDMYHCFMFSIDHLLMQAHCAAAIFDLYLFSALKMHIYD